MTKQELRDQNDELIEFLKILRDQITSKLQELDVDDDEIEEEGDDD